MNKKSQGGFLGIVIAIVIFYLVIFIIIPQFVPPAELRIQLQNNQLSKPQDGILFYTIISNKDFPLTKIAVDNTIVGFENYFEPTKFTNYT